MSTACEKLVESIEKRKSKLIGHILRLPHLAVVLFVFLHAVLIKACIEHFEYSFGLIAVLLIAWIYIIFNLYQRYLSTFLNISFFTHFRRFKLRPLRIAIQYILLFALFAYVIYLCILNSIQFYSLITLVILLAICVLLSNNPARIQWRPIVWGIILQYIAGFIVLNWQFGRTILQWSVEQFVHFLSYTNNGTYYVFGFIANPPDICGMEAPFSFTSLPIIIFFTSLCSAFYYLGIVQWLLVKIAYILQYSMGTTAAESLNAAASVFLGPTEACIMMSTSLRSMTESEILATMTAGFALISGSLFAIYISFGVCPSYLLASNMMSAPAVLTVSKLMQPEIQKSHQKLMKQFVFPPAHESNLLESISVGAVGAVTVLSAIISNVIVFIAIVSVFDTILDWLAGLIGFEGITFNVLLGYTFYPLAYIMGVSDASDTERQREETLLVAQLIGTKTFLNEFIAYQQMSEMLLKKQLGGRAQLMAVFACCGYSNFSQIGSQLGIFGALEPKRKKSFARMAFKSMIAGSIACFMTATVAGSVVSGNEDCGSHVETAVNCVQLG